LSIILLFQAFEIGVFFQEKVEDSEIRNTYYNELKIVKAKYAGQISNVNWEMVKQIYINEPPDTVEEAFSIYKTTH